MRGLAYVLKTPTTTHRTQTMSATSSPTRYPDPFVTHSQKIWRVAALDENTVPTNLDAALNAFLDAEYPVKDVGDQAFADLLIAGCKVVATKDRVLCPKFCKLIFIVCNKQIKIVHLRQQTLETLLLYLLKGLKDTADQAETRVDMLRALSTLLFENTTNTLKHTDSLLTAILPLAHRDTRPLEVRRMAINCLGNMCAGAGSKLQPHYPRIYETLVGNIHVVGGTFSVSAALNFADPGVRKIASSTLRALQLLLIEDSKLIVSPQFDTIEIVRTFVFYHVDHPGYGQAYADYRRGSDADSPLSPSTSLTLLSPRNSASTSGNPAARRPSFQVKPLLAKRGPTSSDSEMSDGDSISGQTRQRDDARIRINALGCLQTIAKTSPRALYPHWTKFIPDTPTAVFSSPTIHTPQPPSLFTVLARDPAHTVRAAACNALVAILDGAKQYLSVAAERDVKLSSSFTSLSEKMASITRELHVGLARAMDRETHQAVLVLLFKCIRVLVENCSYDRLSPGYLSKLYNVLVGYQSTSVPVIRAASLNALASIVDAKSGQDEVGDLIQRESIDPPLTIAKPSLSDTKKRNLPRLLRAIVAAPDEPATVRVEAWSVFCACARTQAAVVRCGGRGERLILGWTGWNSGTICNLMVCCGRNTWTEMEPTLRVALADVDPSIRTAALTFMEAYAKALAESVVEGEDRVRTEHLDHPVQAFRDLTKENCSDFSPYFIPTTVNDPFHLLLDIARAVVERGPGPLRPALLRGQVRARPRSGLRLHIQHARRDLCGIDGKGTCSFMASRTKTFVLIGASISHQKNRQILCVVLLLGLASDDDANVRAAVCRALGVFILFPDLREDSLFITDMAIAVLQQLSDKNVLVRVRASWALGNLCDALVLQKHQNVSTDISEYLSQDLWLKIVRASLTISADNDKLKPNGVRALGSIMCVSPAAYIMRDNGSLMREVVGGLMKNVEAGSLKVRWNACHAASNMLLNPDLPVGMTAHPVTGEPHLAPWTNPLYDSLLKSLRQCKNFKVRINAALALASPARRERFGDAAGYARVIEAVVDAMEHVEDVAERTSFVEMKYVEQFREQLVATIIHLDKLATTADRETSRAVFDRARLAIALNMLVEEGGEGA
ncbi:hypothetical protein BC936DRAFT_148199 [Jimgerdemannia flammicorona]|uniref:DUF4042 domain-containing protein n=1 Tax=Jimgerdemannia flammicorona TaxID=994334 RepID=A0A433D3J4_9FUNG|nr:hypothetical protein BC936DRAFT_148199 [Jimgerdemannia flammicorona]